MGGGNALLQSDENGTEDGGERYLQCLKVLEAHQNDTQSLSLPCQQFVQRLMADDESGHADAVEHEYVHETDEDDGGQSVSEYSDWIHTSFSDLPTTVQDKFRGRLEAMG